ncbi:hypothetical protein BDW71DRAFT_184699 [Aspergillus fruticulosus]
MLRSLRTWVQAGAVAEQQAQGYYYRLAGPSSKKRGDQVQVGFKISAASDSPIISLLSLYKVVGGGLVSIVTLALLHRQETMSWACTCM